MSIHENGKAIVKEVSITIVAAVPPQLITPFGGRRWLDEWIPPPRNKQQINRLRATLLDAILTTLRDLRETQITSIVGHGEGAIIAMATLSKDLREAAFKHRRTSADETKHLDEIAQSVEHVLLLAPHVFPTRSYMPLLREYAPEVVCV